MANTYRPQTGSWWRFDQYEIRDGLIRPKPGATLEEYDPWEEYQASRQRGSGSEPPYQSLARLAANATFGVDHQLRPESERPLLDWCAHYGLLGVLLQFFDVLPSGGGDFNAEEDTRPTWRSYVWTAGGWTEQYTEYPFVDAYPGGLGLTPGSFFPSSGPVEKVPRPDGPQFRAQYCEPVGEFMQQAKTIKDTLDGLTPSDTTTDSFWRAIEALNTLTGSVAPFLHPILSHGRRTLCERWAFRSLIASLAMMIHRDLMHGERVYICATCGAPFTSRSPKATYCSLTCRNTAQKRRQRERQKSRPKEEL